MGQGDRAWPTKLTLLGWDLDKIAHLLHVPPWWQEKVKATLEAIPRIAHTTLLRKGRKLLGLLCSITPTVAGSRGIFTPVQHSLEKAADGHVHLTADVNDDLEAWSKLVCSLASRPTHLRGLQYFS